MLTALIIVMVWFGNDPSQTIFLDYNRPLDLLMTKQRNIWNEQIVILDDKVYFFDFSGALIQSFGGKGSGPGKYENLGALGVEDDTFIIFDRNRNVLGIHDRETGTHLRTHRLNAIHMFPDLERERNFLFVLDYKNLPKGKSSIQYLQVYDQPILSELMINEEHNQTVSSTFHIPSLRIKRWAFDDSRHWPRVYNNAIYVVDELNPAINIYPQNGEHHLEEKKLKLKEFVESPKEFADVPRMTKTQYRNWFYSFSRMLDFNIKGGKILIAYVVPGDKEEVYTYRVAIFDHDLTLKKSFRFAGHYESNLYYIQSNSKFFGMIADVGEDWPKYRVDFYEW